MKIIIETSGVESKKLSLTDTFEYHTKRAQINKEINSQKVEIDRTVFKKSFSEKSELKKAIKAFVENTKDTKNIIIEGILKGKFDAGDIKLNIN